MPGQIKMPRFIEQGTNLITKGFESKAKQEVPDASQDKSFELPRRDIGQQASEKIDKPEDDYSVQLTSQIDAN